MILENGADGQEMIFSLPVLPSFSFEQEEEKKVVPRGAKKERFTLFFFPFSPLSFFSSLPPPSPLGERPPGSPRPLLFPSSSPPL